MPFGKEYIISEVVLPQKLNLNLMKTIDQNDNSRDKKDRGAGEYSQHNAEMIGQMIQWQTARKIKDGGDKRRLKRHEKEKNTQVKLKQGND